jgi:formylglycine-generating enzyme required for sulfatase activity
MPAAAPAPSDRVTITTPIHLELVRIPAGEFLMGSDPAKDQNARKDEQPQHRVYVSEFFIGKYPITNEQYAAFVRATKHKIPRYWKKGEIPQDKENHPIVTVSWNDALAFCEWLSRANGHTCRLPTEAEWEKAARGTDGRIYPWGNEWDKTKLNSSEGGPGGTTAVGHSSPGGDSLYGATDIAGNVWEWCAGWYGEKEYQHQARTAIKDPQGSFQGQGRVLRGGAFDYAVDFARCAYRLRRFPDLRNYFIGFRVVVSLIL